MAVLLVKQIKAKRFSLKGARQQFDNAIRRRATKVKNDYQKTTASWTGAKPSFVISRSVSARAGELGLLVGVGGGSDEGANKFLWLDEGTDVRFATMTRGFIAKTSPGMIGSRAGRGGVAYINPDKPMPGIEARRFTETIEKLHRRAFKRDMERALREILRNKR